MVNDIKFIISLIVTIILLSVSILTLADNQKNEYQNNLDQKILAEKNIYLTESVINNNTINFNENDQLNVVLSQIDSNRLFVQGDRIQSIYGNTALYSAVNDESGSIYLTVNSSNSFTIFVTTELGRHFSLMIIPQRIRGKTVIFMPQQSGIKMPHWEIANEYQHLLVNLLKAVMINQVPEGYGKYEIKASKDEIIKHDIALVPVVVYRGNQLVITDYLLKNKSNKTVILAPAQFYQSGTRAIALVDQEVAAHNITHLYTIDDNDGNQ